MKKDAFTFLRATFFRWAKTIEKICSDLSDAPAVLSVGDTHVENFGTWRDAEGRLVWGVNDFDEAAVIPYPLDLVRLATSVRLAPGVAFSNHDAASAIAAGYRKGLNQPRPTLLDENAAWMLPFVACTDEEREKFWDEVRKYPAAIPPDEVKSALRSSLAALGRGNTPGDITGSVIKEVFRQIGLRTWSPASRAILAEGEVLDVLVQTKRNKASARPDEVAEPDGRLASKGANDSLGICKRATRRI